MCSDVYANVQQRLSTYKDTHTAVYLAGALLHSSRFFPLSFPDLILSHRLMSKESPAGCSTEGKLPCYSQQIAAKGVHPAIMPKMILCSLNSKFAEVADYIVGY